MDPGGRAGRVSATDPAVHPRGRVFAMRSPTRVGAFGGLDQFEGKGFGYRLLVYPLFMLMVP